MRGRPPEGLPASPVIPAPVKKEAVCRLCASWRRGKWLTETSKTCEHIPKGTTPHADACPRFELSKIFFCEEVGHVFAAACAHRYRQSMEDCGTCPTGRTVRRLCR